MVKSTTVVVLKDVDPYLLVSKHYSISPKKDHQQNVSKSKKTVVFQDPSKSPQKLWITMYDLHGSSLPMSTSKKCHNCHHGFKSSPIGLPLRYVVPKTKEEIDKARERFRSMNVTSETFEYFETEGYYCSFPCVKNAILEKDSVKYRSSLSLLNLLYYKMYGKETLIPRAPGFEMLNEYGGYMNIEEFRGSFGVLDLRELPNLRRPFMFSSSSYILEKKQQN
jgi:hypothetical protein